MLKYINPFDKEFPAATYTFVLVTVMFIGWLGMSRKSCKCEKATDESQTPTK
jgi:hypothetical protein